MWRNTNLLRDTDARVSPKLRANRRAGRRARIRGRNTSPNRRCILRLTHGTSVPGPQTTGIELWLPVRFDQFQSINPAWRLLNGRKSGSLKSAACGTPPCRAYRP
jgi:hypothetical protein